MRLTARTSDSAKTSERVPNFDLRPPVRPIQPEKRLMLAVLEDAVNTVLQESAETRAERRLIATTKSWFAAEDYDWPFSFVRICQALELDVNRVRRWIATLQRERSDATRTPPGHMVSSEAWWPVRRPASFGITALPATDLLLRRTG